jgi:hypothetical protein
MNRCQLFLMLVLTNQVQSAYAQEAAAAAGRVSMSNGRISVRAADVPLRQVLDDLRQATGISFSAFPGADAEVVSAAINDAPLEQGLRILLGRYDSIFLYSANDKGAADLKKVWVYQKGEATGLEPAAAEALAGTKTLREKLNDPDSGVRARAFEAILARPGIEEQELVIRTVLSERDDSLRARMIESVRSSSLQLPSEFWGSLSADPSEQIRLLVLNALEGTSRARDSATLALTDPSPHVQLRAKEILDSLGASGASAPGCDGCVRQK